MRYMKRWPILPLLWPPEPILGGWWPAGTVWGFDAVNGRYTDQGVGVQESAAVTFTRSTVAFRKTSETLWSSTAINTMRIETGGIRLEPAATNRLLRSNDMTHAAWVLTGTATKEATSIPAPAYGNWTRFYRGSETGNLCQQQCTPAVAGQDTCGSIFVMGEGADIGKKIRIEAKRGAGATFVSSITTVTLTAEPQRVYATFQPAADSTTVALAILAASAAGDRASAVLLACPQMETGLVPTSPIETGAATATRTIDQLSAILPASVDLVAYFAPALTPIKQSSMSYRGLTYTIQQAVNPLAAWALGRRYETSDVLQFTVKPGDVTSFDTPDKERSELLTSTRYAKNVSVWNAHAFKIHSGFEASTDPGAWFILGQWHGDSDADGRSPYIAINLIGNDLVITRRYFDGSGDGQSLAIPMYTLPNVARDVWFNIIIEHKVVDDTNGVMNVWLAQDGEAMVQVVTFTGAVGYWDHANGGYWKFGIYRQAAAFTGTVEYQNNNEGTASLAARIATPLAIDDGTQTIAATAGVFPIDAAILNHRLVERFLAVAA